jgi:hypothetical protein
MCGSVMRRSLVAAYTAHWKIAVSGFDGGGLVAIRSKDGKPIPKMAGSPDKAKDEKISYSTFVGNARWAPANDANSAFPQQVEHRARKDVRRILHSQQAARARCNASI